jgi:hypothetical protein
MSFESFRAELVIVDGRQSPTAQVVCRGASRLLMAHGFACIYELPLASGRRADIVALHADGTIWVVEVKSSIEDFRVDQKWPDYRLHCDRLFFATAAHVPLEIFPEDAGLILADAYGADMVRQAPEHRLPPATRRSLLLRFARTAAQRLQSLNDPHGPYGADL